MKINNIDLTKEVFIIAEIGNNHEGDFETAKKLIRFAAKTGVHAVKFQTFIPENYVFAEDVDRISKLKKFQLNYNKFSLLSEIKEKVGLSNKKWDKAVKGLVEKKLVKVIKNEEGLFIELVQWFELNKPSKSKSENDTFKSTYY